MMKRSTAALAACMLLLGSVNAHALDAADRERYVLMFDMNKDGRVSKEEFVAHAEAIWGKIESAKVESKQDKEATAKQFRHFLDQLKKSDG
jgi:hypothetical protein